MRGTWEDTRVELGQGRLLADGSDSEPRVQGLFEQSRIAQEITSSTAAFLVRDDASGPNGLLIALHGRHGQGKSAVIDEIESALNFRMLRGKTRRFPVRLARFNCADYSHEDLKDNFDYFLESARGWPLFLPVLFVVCLLSFLSLSLSGLFVAFGIPESDIFWVKIASALITIFAGFFILGLRPFRLLVRDIWRQLRIGKGLVEVLLHAVDRVFISFDVLVVDDLDRADIQQQQALLHSLRRHREDINGVVIVAFDDAPLISAVERNVDVAELLTKVFDVSYRLSPMNARDAALMASGFAEELVKLNPKCEVAQVFREPMIIGDLARVFVLHGNASARFAKKLINSVYASARLGNFRRITDFAALIRLHGVFQYVPALEAEVEPIANSLLDVTDSDLLQYVQDRFGKELPAVFSRRLNRFLSRTSHMQPSNVGWMRILRIWRNRPIGAAGDLVCPVDWSKDASLSWALNDAFLASREAVADRARAFNSILQPGNELLRYNHIELRSSGTGVATTSRGKASQLQSEYWAALALRLKVHDDDLIQTLSDSEKLDLVEAHQKLPVGHLLTFRRSGIRFSNISDLFRHNLLSRDINLKHRLEYELSEFLLNPQDGITQKLPLTRALDGADATAINAAWPDFHLSNDPQLVRKNFETLVPIIRDFSFDEAVLPTSHKEFLLRSICDGSYEAAYLEFSVLMPDLSLPSETHFWPVGAARELWEALEKNHEQYSGFMLYLSTRAAAPWKDFQALWLMAQSRSEQLRSTAIDLPELVSDVIPSNWDHLVYPLWNTGLFELSEQWPSLGKVLRESPSV